MSKGGGDARHSGIFGQLPEYFVRMKEKVPENWGALAPDSPPPPPPKLAPTPICKKGVKGGGSAL